jgi:outer membrane lipoprotein SlyB
MGPVEEERSGGMLVRWVMSLLVPVALAAAVTGCNDGGVQPGVVNTSAAQGYRGETGRVVEIREVPIKRGGSGMNDGTLIGGGLGAAGGAAIGGATTNSVGGAVIGGLLGAVAGGIAGTAIDRNSTRRGIEVTVQRDDGQRVTIAQYDDGDVQMGDRVQIVYDRNGVAKVVRDNGQRRD